MWQTEGLTIRPPVLFKGPPLSKWFPGALSQMDMRNQDQTAGLNQTSC